MYVKRFYRVSLISVIGRETLVSARVLIRRFIVKNLKPPIIPDLLSTKIEGE